MAGEQDKADETPKPAGPVVEMVPEGDNRLRMVCTDCGFIHYRNPLVVVGAVCAWEGRILLCRRAIDPRRGYWTIPAGYLELKETTQHGAAREAWEEAGARIAPEDVLAVYSIPRLSQVQVIYRAPLMSPDIEAGPESLEVGLFGWSEIPWEDLAFPSVRWALDHYRSYLESGDPTPRGNPPGETGRY
ncbi:MAG: NUDIX hydrolase [Rhodospirillaceae bacterium]|nr:NUDIX hydrolase [Rhodospirillaceae bacterium]|tara:strand:- start:620 stop:1183 length:564 start_codon:yes stop_codon:yes gene_type:complete